MAPPFVNPNLPPPNWPPDWPPPDDVEDGDDGDMIDGDDAVFNDEEDDVFYDGEEDADVNFTDSILDVLESDTECLKNMCGDAFDIINLDTIPSREGYSEGIATLLENLWIKLWGHLSYGLGSQFDDDSQRRGLERNLLNERCLQIRSRENFAVLVHLARLGYRGEIIFPTAYIRDTFLGNVDSSPPFSVRTIVDYDEDLYSFLLNTGARIPAVGLSTCLIDASLVGQAVESAIKVGYRYIDCAPINGNEKEIGETLKALLDDGIVKREELFISSKVWCNHASNVALALDNTLKDLMLDYIDLYLIHWPVRLSEGSILVEPHNLRSFNLPSTWGAMEAVYDSGKARAIGVSNFSVKKLQKIVDVARIPPAVDQVECHPMWAQNKLHAFCSYQRIHLSGYSPLGRHSSPPSQFLGVKVLDHPYIIHRARIEALTPAQYVLRWGLWSGHSVLPTSSSKSRIKENIDIFDEKDVNFKGLKFLPQERKNRGSEFVHEIYGDYRTLEDLWDEEKAESEGRYTSEGWEAIIVEEADGTDI